MPRKKKGPPPDGGGPSDNRSSSNERIDEEFSSDDERSSETNTYLDSEGEHIDVKIYAGAASLTFRALQPVVIAEPVNHEFGGIPPAKHPSHKELQEVTDTAQKLKALTPKQAVYKPGVSKQSASKKDGANALDLAADDAKTPRRVIKSKERSIALLEEAREELTKKLIKHALSGKGHVSLRAVEHCFDMLDGKAASQPAIEDTGEVEDIEMDM